MDHFRSTERKHVISFVKVNADNPSKDSGRILDISSVGMRLRSRKKIEPNRAFTFSMLIPNINYRRKVVTFDASVIWSNESEQDGYHDCGIMLESISEKDKEIIDQFIKDSSHRDRWIAVAECFAQEH